jgi:catechol 2,3-dioxygenase-like lactoylglutathione lyase family enzyme
MKIPLIAAFALFCAAPAFAQLVSPNSDGVSMGAVQLIVRDVDANVKFFKLMGGTPVSNGAMQLIEFPRMYIELEKGDPAGGTAGSIINHFGFQVQSMNQWIPKWQAAGIKIEPMVRPTQAFLVTPDDARIEVLEDPTLSTPIAGHHVHFFTPDVKGMQAWYGKTFGAVPGVRAQFQAADLPGVNLTFSPSSPPTVPTKGRTLDAIDFEVSDLRAFLARLQAAGIKLDEPYAKVPHTSMARASFTDPWGVRIELSEGLAPAQHAALQHSDHC